MNMMKKLASPSLLLLLACATSSTQASSTAPAKPARAVSPAIHQLQRMPQKSGTATAEKPALPPRRPGPVVKLDAVLGTDDRLQLHCDQHDGPSRAASGDPS
ncbi:MAG: hypothetical protein R3F22_01160 [Lysobacteraceae bacterium]